MKKGGFADYLSHKRYRRVDLYESFIFLPFGYAVIRLIAGKFDVLTTIIIGLLILVYIPALLTFLGWRRKRE